MKYGLFAASSSLLLVLQVRRLWWHSVVVTCDCVIANVNDKYGDVMLSPDSTSCIVYIKRLSLLMPTCFAWRNLSAPALILPPLLWSRSTYCKRCHIGLKVIDMLNLLKLIARESLRRSRRSCLRIKVRSFNGNGGLQHYFNVVGRGTYGLLR